MVRINFNLSSLNEVQRNAVTRTEGPVLILAGAGSGKTRTLIYRLAWLLFEKNVNPEQILAVTFTNKAASEMRNRIEQIAGGTVRNLWLGTFHSIFARLLRRECTHLGYEPNFSIYDTDDSSRALKKVLSSHGIPQQLNREKIILNKISRAKNKFIKPNQINTADLDLIDQDLPQIYQQYEIHLKKNNAMDFDDLLIKPLDLFFQHPDVLEKYTTQFKYILVDEYQDTNHAQYLLVKNLTGKHHNICVVGDEDQSIYGWRGADIQNILSFNRDFPEAAVFKLEENYRSTRIILSAANALVNNNTDRLGKTMFSNRSEGEKISFTASPDPDQEAQKIIEMIHDEIFSKKRSFKDIAILYRTNAQSRALEDAMRRNNINYTVIGNLKFYDRKEIKDLVSYLRLVVNPADSVALKRIINFPLRGVGETTVSKIEKFSEMEGITLFDGLIRVREISTISETMGQKVIGFHELISKFVDLQNKISAGELVRTLAAECGLMHHYKTEYDQYESENRVANLQEFMDSIDDFSEAQEAQGQEARLNVFLQQVSLTTDVDSYSEDQNSVTLMTLHSAKGLEFPVVFVTGLENGLIPMHRPESTMTELEEERRLLYVGMTRAQEKLHLSMAMVRRRQNKFKESELSPFYLEIPPKLIDVRNAGGNLFSSKAEHQTSRRRKAIQNYFDSSNPHNQEVEIYWVGQFVFHETFGKGKISQIEGDGDKMKITVNFFEFDGGIIKKLIKQYANLTPIESMD